MIQKIGFLTCAYGCFPHPQLCSVSEGCHFFDSSILKKTRHRCTVARYGCRIYSSLISAQNTKTDIDIPVPRQIEPWPSIPRQIGTSLRLDSYCKNAKTDCNRASRTEDTTVVEKVTRILEDISETVFVFTPRLTCNFANCTVLSHCPV